MKAFNFALILIVFCCFSCKKDQAPENQSIQIPSDPNATAAVYVVNEGNFQWGNGSISLFKVKESVVEDDIFNRVNARPLGDVVQSMEFFKGKFYVVVNNSQKIEIIDPATFKSTGVIANLHSPRYFKGISVDKAYVSNIWSNNISVVDLISNSVVKNIPCKGWTEEMLLFRQFCITTNLFSDYIYFINTINDQIEDSLKLSYGSNSMQLDRQGKLWVLCSGDEQKGLVGVLHKIDPISKQLELSLPFFNATEAPHDLRINKSGDTLYFLNKALYSMAVSSYQLPSKAFIDRGLNFYGLGVDPKSGELYVSDAVDYVQKGMVYRYAPSGALIASFRAGIIPGEFCFK